MVKIAIWIWALILAAIFGYAAIQDKAKKQEPAKRAGLENHYKADQFERFIRGAGAKSYTTVERSATGAIYITTYHPWIEIDSDIDFMLGWQDWRIFPSEQSHSGIRLILPAGHFSWNAVKAIRDFDQKERQR